MRIALISDIHGNPLALDAVLDDIAQRGGVDRYLFGGDYAALGYDPAGPIERITALPNAAYVRGNTDVYTTTGARPGPTLDAAQSDPALVPTLVQIRATFAWTHGVLTGAGHIGWLAGLPLEHRMTLPDGTRLLLVHAAPGMDDGPGLTHATTDAELAAMIAQVDADLIVVGHTHWPQDRRTANARMINTGSVSNPHAPDLRASYALLRADADGYDIEFRRVAYDIEAVLAALERAGHPAIPFVSRYFEGRSHPAWIDMPPGGGN